MEFKGTSSNKIILNKNKDEGLRFSHLKTYYKAVLNRVLNWVLNSVILTYDQCNTIKSPEVSCHIHGQLYFDKDVKTIQWEKNKAFFLSFFFNFNFLLLFNYSCVVFLLIPPPHPSQTPVPPPLPPSPLILSMCPL